MKSINSFVAHRPFIIFLAGIVIWSLCLGGTASAQSTRAIPAGTTIDVRTTEPIHVRDTNGRVFRGVVDRDVLGGNGRLVIPRGSTAELIVRPVSADDLALDLDSVVIHGERYGVASTSAVVSEGRDQGLGVNERTGKYVGGGALLGAIVGGIAGGGKGAAIGAGAGAAAGAGAQIMTRGGQIEVPEQSLLTFQLTQPLRAGIRDEGYQRSGVHYHQGYSNAPYERGFRDGREDAARNLPEEARPTQFVDRHDRQDYMAGYNAGYEDFNNAQYGRQKPSYAGSPWRINIQANRTVTWQAPDNATVYVQADDGPWKLFASGQSGTQAAPWIQPGHRYVFVLRDPNGNEVARAEQDLR